MPAPALHFFPLFLTAEQYTAPLLLATLFTILRIEPPTTVAHKSIKPANAGFMIKLPKSFSFAISYG